MAARPLLDRLGTGRFPVAVDVVLAVALTAVLQFEIWTQGGEDAFVQRSLSSTVLLLLTVPLIWRRRAPLAVAAGNGVGRAVQAIATGTWVASFGILFSTLIALYSAGAYAERRALLGLAFVLAGLTVATAYDFPVGEADLWNGMFFYLLCVLVFATGRYVRSRRQALELERDAARIKRQTEEQARAVAEERARIARELHDVVAHSVSATVVQAEAAEEVLDREPDSTRRSLRRIQRTGREALSELRSLLGIMRGQGSSGELRPQPGINDLHRLVRETSEQGLPVTLVVEGAPRKIAPGVDLSAYRIVQEALTNVRKHAPRSATARVVIRFEQSSLELEVADDGPGPQPGTHDGHGLIGMRERVAFFGGEFRAGKRNGGGFVVQARFPLAAPAP